MSDQYIQIWDDHETQNVRLHVVVDGQTVADIPLTPDEARRTGNDFIRWAEMPSRHNLDEVDCEFCRSRT